MSMEESWARWCTPVTPALVKAKHADPGKKKEKRKKYIF
jgi:hypothetical protein